MDPKNKSRGGSSSGRGNQGWATGAWGQPNTAQRLGIRGGPSWSGPTPAQGRNNPNPRGGRQHPIAPPRGKAVQIDHEEQEYDDDDEEEDAYFSDDSDEYAFSDSGSDEGSCSHESLKGHKMFKNWFKKLDSLTLEQINDPAKRWHCPACKDAPGGTDWYDGVQPLVDHARTKSNRRAKLHRLFEKVLKEELLRRGASTAPAGEVFGDWHGPRDGSTYDHQIVWPPMVLVMNTRLDNRGDDDKWSGMGNQELVQYFSSYSPVKARHSYGPRGHRGFSLLFFESSAFGYLEAERLHKHFLIERTGREAWNERSNLFHFGGKRLLYGWLANKDDLKLFNQHYQEKQAMKYELRSYNEKVVSELKKINEDYQRLFSFKQKADEEKNQAEGIKETVILLTDKYRKMFEENLIVRQRSIMHHQHHQEELDYQENFFKAQLEQIQASVIAKEAGFERFQQDERRRVEDLNSHTSSRRRMEEVERFIQCQEQEMSHFALQRDELQKIHEKRKDEMKMRVHRETLAMESEFGGALTKLMEMYAPGSTSGDA